MKYEKITGDMLNAFRVDAKIALAKVAEKYGLVINLKGMTYLDTSFSGRYEAYLKGKDTKEIANYKTKAKMLNLLPLGTEIMIKKEKYEIIGLKTRAKKNPVLIKAANGKVYVTSLYTATKNSLKSK
jgi:hypothetical protein